MFQLRCFVTDPRESGVLLLVTLKLQSNCAPIMDLCMQKALDKWHRLFTLKVLSYTLSDMGAVMLVYVPNACLSTEEAKRRNEDFDLWLDAQRTGRPKSRRHHFSAEQLRNPSYFFRLFNPDLRRLHRTVAPPKDLSPGYSRYPVYSRRYSAMTVQADALPPVFTTKQLEQIRIQLKQFGFGAEAKTSPLRDLYISPHGIGSFDFLAELEDRCCDYLVKINRPPVLWKHLKGKYIVRLNEKVWERRLAELIAREPYEDYPRVWSLLLGLDTWSDLLLTPECYGRGGIELPPHLQRQTARACLPLSLTLLLADGLLRWYYKSQKDVEFPHYNYYRRLQPWEV